jgi:predicted ester cyclase
MRALCKGVIAIGLASWIVGAVDAQPAPPAACPATTQVESTAIARAWHDDVINRRNPVMLRDIVGPEVVHHAAGGYPKVLNAEGIAAMMGDFLVAFPDLLITFDQFIAKDDFVVERYTASGTHQGPLGDLQPTNRTATWTGINIFRIGCGRIVEVWSEVDAEGRRRQLTVPLTTRGP